MNKTKVFIGTTLLSLSFLSCTSSKVSHDAPSASPPVQVSSPVQHSPSVKRKIDYYDILNIDDQRELIMHGQSDEMEYANATSFVANAIPQQRSQAPVVRVEPKVISKDNPKSMSNSWKSVSASPQSTFSIDVDGASYSMIRSQLQRGLAPSKDEVRIEEMVNYFNYKYQEPQSEEDYKLIMGLQDCPWEKGDKLVRVALKSKSVDFSKAPINNLVFLVDVSGSMSSANKLPLVRASLTELVKNLRPNDRIAIVVYAGSSGLVLPSTPALESHKIISALNSLNSGGSTAGGAGIQLAYKVAQENFVEGGNNRIILATDGDFNVGTSSTTALVDLISEKRKSGVFLSVLGFGRGNFRDHRVEQIANNGNGNFYYIDGIKEAQRVLVKEMAGTLIATAKDVKVQVEFNPKHVSQYRLIGYENRLLNNEDFRRDEVDAGELGASMNVTALYQLKLHKDNSKDSAENLKYQNSNLSQAAQNGEWMNIKIRHKAPDADKSVLNVFAFHPAEVSSDLAMNRAVSVAGFGMLLKNSLHKGTVNYKMLKDMVQLTPQESNDRSGQWVEYLDLLDRSERINQKASK
jgi:Ca-activated chloride channel family protein